MSAESKRYQQIVEDRKKQIEFLEQRGINPYPAETPPRTHKNAEIARKFDELKDTEVSVVGRMVTVRGHGKRYFFDLADESGKTQITFDMESIGEEMIDVFSHGYGVGDFVGVTGKVIKTKSGQPTVEASDITMLAKAMLPPPVGLTDGEILTRQRHLDLLLHKEVVERFKFRSKMVQDMRNAFLGFGFWEMQTPIMDTVYGGASARPFTTYHNALGKDLFLRISNELYLKKLMVGGFEGVFEFSTDFRNEGIDATHNPEFTQVELYVAYKDYNWMMEMSENLMSGIAQKELGTTKIQYQNKEIDLSTPWRRLTVNDGVREYAGINPDALSDEELIEIAKKEGIMTKDGKNVQTDRGYIILGLFDNYAEKNLINPTFVIDYPKSTSPLTKDHRSKKGIVERFECYVAGMEVMNCYSELNDPRVQQRNFEEEEIRRMEGDSEAMPTDKDFIQAMKYGMPPMGGIGISIDRWAMLYTNSSHIRDVISFPVMRPLNNVKGKTKPE
jgi:lysyl-tRNA synthetase class 2